MSFHLNSLLVTTKKKPGNKNKQLHPKYVINYKPDRCCQLKTGRQKITMKV